MKSSPPFLKAAIRQLSKDAKLAELIKKHGVPEFRRTTNAFKTLCRAIVGQQLSTKAAATIWGRFVDLYPRKTPKANLVAVTSEELLRGVGLSRGKASYVRDLASHFERGDLSGRKLGAWNDERVREGLLAVKGLGPWSVDMFLIFGLNRPDVLPVGDLGIQKGMQQFFKLRERPKADKMEKLAAEWQPYRSVASWYMWRLLENE